MAFESGELPFPAFLVLFHTVRAAERCVRVSDLACLDLWQVFDTVPQDVLVCKCRSHAFGWMERGAGEADELQRCFPSLALPCFWVVILGCWPNAGNVFFPSGCYRMLLGQ